MFVWATGLLRYWATGLLGYWTTALLGYWTTGLLDYWATGLLDYWATGLLGYSFQLTVGDLLYATSLKKHVFIYLFIYFIIINYYNYYY